jgi:hypothetical protein
MAASFQGLAGSASSNQMDVAHSDINEVILEVRATGAPSHLKIRSLEAINDLA